MSILSSTPPVIEYPETDNQPMAENTLQFQWIVTIKEGLECVFADRPDVFVAGDLFWYPVEGNPEIRAAPDAMVVIGRPKGHRRSYQQWQEGDLPPQVVFEVLSPGNRPGEMCDKRKFYERHGVEEYYVYDPDEVEMEGFRRSDGLLAPIADLNGWTSPRLGIRFELDGPELVIRDPDGRPFRTFQENRRELDRARHERDQIAADRDRLAARLRAAGIDPDQ